MKVTNYSENVAMLRALKEIAKVTSQLGPDRPSAQYMAETANRIALSAIDAARAEAESTWRCFHCGFCTTDYEQAEAHFGDRDEEMALCVWWKESTDLERFQALQDAIEEQNAALAEVARLREKAELLDLVQSKGWSLTNEYSDTLGFCQWYVRARVVGGSTSVGRGGTLLAALRAAKGGKL